PSMGARFYDSEHGRWISPDSIIPDPKNPQNLNRYAYVLANPLKSTDRTGHCIDRVSTWFCVGAALVGGLVVAVDVVLDIASVPPVKGERVAPPTTSDVTPWLIDQIQKNSQADGTYLMRDNVASWNPVNKAGATKAW